MNIDMKGNFQRVSNAGNSKPTKNLQKKSTIADEGLAVGFKDLLKNKKDAYVKTVNKNEDTLTISGYGNVSQKLVELQKIHEETDYSGMSDMEIYKLINDRYENAFPHRSAKMTLNTDKYQDIGIQNRANLYAAIKNPNFVDLRGEAAYERRKEYLGYQGLSNSEIIQKIKKDIPDDGSLENKVEVMNQLWIMGVISTEASMAFDSSIRAIQRQTFKDAFGQEALKDINFFSNWIKNGGTENMKMSWGEMREHMFSRMNIEEVYGLEVKKELNNLFDDFIK